METSSSIGSALNHLVALQVEITRIEGKWKLSQNHARERREKVIDALTLQRGENSLAIAALMARTLPRAGMIEWVLPYLL